jgi:hypothetical protein
MSDESLVRADEVELESMTCPSCGKQMHYYGGSAGFICCEYKVLYRTGGWFDPHGTHVADDRLASGSRSVAGVVTKVD